MQISRILKKGTTFPSWVITGLENTETRCAVLDRRVVHEPTRISSNTDLHLRKCKFAHQDKTSDRITMVPLLSSAPLAQRAGVREYTTWILVSSSPLRSGVNDMKANTVPDPELTWPDTFMDVCRV